MKYPTPLPEQMSLPGIDMRRSFREISPLRLPTNTTAKHYATHRWFNFIAGFAPEFVARVCPANGGALLLDPFAGCGTSLVVAQGLGHRAIGFEPHPFFVRIARAKTGPSPTRTRLQAIEEALLHGISAPETAAPVTDDADTFLTKLFEERTLRRLLGARAALHTANLDSDDLAFLILSRIVEMCSKALTDGIYKAPTTAKRAEAPEDAVRAVFEQVRGDVALTDQAAPAPAATLYDVSSEDMSEVATGSVDIAVTSPPLSSQIL